MDLPDLVHAGLKNCAESRRALRRAGIISRFPDAQQIQWKPMT